MNDIQVKTYLLVQARLDSMLHGWLDYAYEQKVDVPRVVVAAYLASSEANQQLLQVPE